MKLNDRPTVLYDINAASKWWQITALSQKNWFIQNRWFVMNKQE